MSRDKKLALRNALFTIETSIPLSDRTKSAERERDLIAVANCAIWDGDSKTIYRALKRLANSPERSGNYLQVMGMLAA